MADRDAERLRSGFLTFDTSEEREAFLSELAKRGPWLRDHLLPSSIGPRIVVRDISSEDLLQLKGMLANRGRWFDDIQFSTTDLVR